MQTLTDTENVDEVLQYACDNSIINIDSIKSAVEDMTTKNILAQHKYALTQGSDGRWSTRIVLDNGKTAVRHRKTKEELEKYLVRYYKEQEETILIFYVFETWINEKLEYNEIKKQSYDKYRSDFNRFFTKDKQICTKKFKNITELDLDHFIKETIRDKHLTRKTYSGLVTLLNGIFKYGKKLGLTSISISTFIKDLYLPKNIFTKRYIDKAKEVFSEEEIPVVTDYLKSNPDIWNLGLLLQFQTGARIGEIATIKRQDIKSHSILICRTEIKIKDECGKWKVVVSELPKTDSGYREIFLPESATWTINKIIELNPSDEFLFSINSKRVRENTFNKRLSIICNKLGLLHRTTHKIRKTYGTTLLDSNVNDSFVAEQMGHSDISTTRKLYYYSNKSRKTKQSQINNAINF